MLVEREPTPASAFPRKSRPSCFSLSSRRSRRAWASACRSAAPSSRRMAGGCGSSRTQAAAASSVSLCRRIDPDQGTTTRSPSYMKSDALESRPCKLIRTTGRRNCWTWPRQPSEWPTRSAIRSSQRVDARWRRNSLHDGTAPTFRVPAACWLELRGFHLPSVADDDTIAAVSNQRGCHCGTLIC